MNNRNAYKDGISYYSSDKMGVTDTTYRFETVRGETIDRGLISAYNPNVALEEVFRSYVTPSSVDLIVIVAEDDSLFKGPALALYQADRTKPFVRDFVIEALRH